MDFYEAVNKRRTTRQFLQKEVDFEAVKRILEAGKMGSQPQLTVHYSQNGRGKGLPLCRGEEDRRQV